MGHALIIDDNIAVSRAIQRYLEPLGFRSFDHTWTEQQALEAAARRRPDIIVIGDDVEAGSAMNAARNISAGSSIPVLLVSGDPARTSKRLAEASGYTGPFLLNQIETAVDLAFGRQASVH